ncbi:MAG: hypothetical protein GY794_09795 [bacterium]|nr:hypothetical protein [bacterium]
MKLQIVPDLLKQSIHAPPQTHPQIWKNWRNIRPENQMGITQISGLHGLKPKVCIKASLKAVPPLPCHLLTCSTPTYLAPRPHLVLKSASQSNDNQSYFYRKI